MTPTSDEIERKRLDSIRSKMEQQRQLRESRPPPHKREARPRREGPSNHERVVEYLTVLGPLIVDEMVAQREVEDGNDRPWVNSVAPAVDKLLRAGIVRRTGIRRPTRSGSLAAEFGLVESVT
jgi:hypothetical protein